MDQWLEAVQVMGWDVTVVRLGREVRLGDKQVFKLQSSSEQGQAFLFLSLPPLLLFLAFSFLFHFHYHFV